MATIQWFPGHMAKALRQIREQMPLVDIVFELVDARVPYSSQNPEVDLAAGDKPRLLILTKTDLADPEVTKEWLQYFKDHGQPVLALDSRARSVAKTVTNAAKQVLAEKLANEQAKGMKKRAIRAMCVGVPNVGKSTLLNYVVGQKVAIMSNVAQTTRNKIQGIYTTDEAQIVFIDTPGVHKPQTKLGDFMERSTLSALDEVDAVLYVVAADEKRGPGDNFIMERLKQVQKPIYLVVNKIDKVHPNELPAIVKQFEDGTVKFADVVPVSALNGNNVNALINKLVDQLPNGPQYYPSDQISDHPERFVIAEMIREKVFMLTRQEVPHSVAVDVMSVKRQDDETVHINANIIVERPGQKGIIIGKKGQMLKQIGTMARKDIEHLLGDRVYLQLWVKVVPGWRDKSAMLKDYGYRSNDY